MAVCALYINSKIFVPSSLLQPQGNGSFYVDSCPPIIHQQREGAQGVQACITLSKISDKHYGVFRETNIIKELRLCTRDSQNVRFPILLPPNNFTGSPFLKTLLIEGGIIWNLIQHLIVDNNSTTYSCRQLYKYRLYIVQKYIGYVCQAVGCRGLLGRQESFRNDLTGMETEGVAKV